MFGKIYKFTIGRLRSFAYAFNGLAYTFKELNAIIHGSVAILVVICGFALKIDKYEWLSVILCIALVLICEAINTAIETVVNMVSPEYNKLAGKAKDIAAAAVLLAAIFSVIIGVIIFLPKILVLF